MIFILGIPLIVIFLVVMKIISSAFNLSSSQKYHTGPNPTTRLRMPTDYKTPDQFKKSVKERWKKEREEQDKIALETKNGQKYLRILKGESNEKS